MKNIPQGRALIYIMLLSLIPPLLVSFYLWNSLGQLDALDSELQNAREILYNKEKKQAINQNLRRFYQESDPFYIDKYLESFSFLETETEALKKLSSHKNIPEDETLKKRLDFLSGPGNALKFTEGVVQNFGAFSETTETLSHPIEINLNDLTKILTRIEGVSLNQEPVPEGKPQLIILDFKMDKKKTLNQNETFLLNMKLLKREFE